MAEVEVKYKGFNIIELNQTEAKKLKTSGKYCEDNFTLTYNRPNDKIFINQLYLYSEEVWNQ